MEKFKIYLFLFVLVFLGGCSGLLVKDEIKITKQPPHPAAKVVRLKVSRAAYEKAVETGQNRIRLVEVFNRNVASGMQEHRFFDISAGSVYPLLGLKNLDVLVRANGYAVAEPARFWDYLLLLPNATEAHIEIRRGGRPIIFYYDFVK